MHAYHFLLFNRIFRSRTKNLKTLERKLNRLENSQILGRNQLAFIRKHQKMKYLQWVTDLFPAGIWSVSFVARTDLIHWIQHSNVQNLTEEKSFALFYSIRQNNPAHQTLKSFSTVILKASVDQNKTYILLILH